MIYVLAFVVAVSVLIVFHEFGHFRVARAFGVKVERFSLGFGKVLWRYQRHPDSTEYVLSALPLGGYVRMLGHGSEPVPPALLPQAFRTKPLWQRACIIAAGPAANLLLAIALYAGFNWIGTEEPQARLGTPTAGTLAADAGLQSGEWIRATSSDGVTWDAARSMTDVGGAVMRAVVYGDPLHLEVASGEGRAGRTLVLATDTLESREPNGATLRRVGLVPSLGEPVLGPLQPGAARSAGLLEGDRVLSVDGEPVTDANHLLALIRANADERAMQWTVERGGQRLTLTVTPQRVDQQGQRFGRIGAALGRPDTVRVQDGFAEGLVRGATNTWTASVLTLTTMGRMVVGQASLKNLSGPVSIADYAGQSARRGLAHYLAFMAVLSVSIGVLNLLPLPLLDGGHLMYYLFEAVTGRPPSDVWLERLTRGGLAIMILMMSLAFYNDVARSLGLH